MGTDSEFPWGKARRRLPLNCEAQYFPKFMTAAESSELFDFLVENCDLSDRRVTIADGTVYQMDTGKFIFADAELTDNRHLPEVLGQRAAWAPPVLAVKQRLEALLSRTFHVCLVIRYKSGEVGAGLHTDMPEFGSVSFLTVISLGAARDFLFKSKEGGEEYRIRLEPGSLLTMGEHCQERYQHGLPEDPACTEPRISLSYRQFGWD
jgi:alkylated DNA repair dioxygenase AlkB